MKKFLDGSFSSIPADMVIKSYVWRKLYRHGSLKLFTNTYVNNRLLCDGQTVNGKEVLEAKIVWNQVSKYSIYI